MKVLKYGFCLMILNVSLLSMPALAQRSGYAKSVARYNERGELVGLYNMNQSSIGDVSCHPHTYVGTIVTVEYEGRRISGLEIKLRGGKREWAGITEFLYNDLSPYDIQNLKDLLVKDKRVRVVAFACGAAGRVVVADSIEALSKMRKG